MSRFSRINTIWRKELVDTLRDRRTLIAMVLVPMVLYPVLMLGSVQAFELRVGQLVRERYTIGVASAAVQRWLRRLIDADPARQHFPAGTTAEQRVARPAAAPATRPQAGAPQEAGAGDVRQRPPPYEIHVVPDVRRAVSAGRVHVGVILAGQPPTRWAQGSTRIAIIYDDSEVRSGIAATGLEGIFERANTQIVQWRLRGLRLAPDFMYPLLVSQQNVASPEKMAGSILGQVVPLILIMMTITGAIYPAIDLTAGERERGTLETLMVAPVPTADLIAGKFIVVALIGMLSAVLNLLSVGGTIYLGGLGEILTPGSEFVFPLTALPWILLLLIPLAVMFSATLLAVCSFARSFKEAQNYIMPVMVAALIPAVVGVLPGTRLEGPLLVMPVANIVVLTRELFLGRFDVVAIVAVLLSTSLYAAAAVAVAAKLFGQEAVQFADSASIRTVFQRRFFKPLPTPTIAQSLLLLALVYPLSFFVQQRLGQSPGLAGSPRFYWALAAALIVLLVLLPSAAARYMRVRPRATFRLALPRPAGLAAALCFGGSTWILARAWFALQQRWFPMPEPLRRMYEQVGGWLDGSPLPVALLLLALVPATCEELFFRGYVLSGVRSALGKAPAVLLVALAFAIYHQSVFRLLITTGLGVLFGLLVVQWRSIWPAIIAHLLHNGLALASSRADGLAPLLQRLGYAVQAPGLPPAGWLLGAGGLLLAGLVLCLLAPGRRTGRPVGLPLAPGSQPLPPR